MRHWVLISGVVPPENPDTPLDAVDPGKRLFAELRKILHERGFDVLALRGEGHAELIDAYREFCEDFAEPGDWVALIGVGQASDSFSMGYYEYLALHPPGAIVLAGGHPELYYLNEITCPYLLVCDKLPESHPLEFAQEPSDELDEAIYRHQQRYGDTTKIKTGALSKPMPKRIASWITRCSERSARQSRKLIA
jgi:hypothetical protein